MIDAVKRIREWIAIRDKVQDPITVVTTEDARAALVYIDTLTYDLAAMAAENARLREALQKIKLETTNVTADLDNYGMCILSVNSYVRTVLEGTTDEHD